MWPNPRKKNPRWWKRRKRKKKRKTAVQNEAGRAVEVNPVPDIAQHHVAVAAVRVQNQESAVRDLALVPAGEQDPARDPSRRIVGKGLAVAKRKDLEAAIVVEEVVPAHGMSDFLNINIQALRGIFGFTGHEGRAHVRQRIVEIVHRRKEQKTRTKIGSGIRTERGTKIGTEIGIGNEKKKRRRIGQLKTKKKRGIERRRGNEKKKRRERKKRIRKSPETRRRTVTRKRRIVIRKIRKRTRRKRSRRVRLAKEILLPMKR